MREGIQAHAHSTLLTCHFLLKRPISSKRPSQLDLDTLYRTQAPAVPAEFSSGRNYQWQLLGEEVVSLTDRQQNPGGRTTESCSHLADEERKKGNESYAALKPSPGMSPGATIAAAGTDWSFSSLIKTERPGLVRMNAVSRSLNCSMVNCRDDSTDTLLYFDASTSEPEPLFATVSISPQWQHQHIRQGNKDAVNVSSGCLWCTDSAGHSIKQRVRSSSSSLSLALKTWW